MKGYFIFQIKKQHVVLGLAIFAIERATGRPEIV